MIKKVIKMSASWCSPCKSYAKTFEEVSKNEDFKDILFEEYDVEENEDLTEKFGVRSIPTTIFLDENEDKVLMMNGNISKKVLEETIKEQNS